MMIWIIVRKYDSPGASVSVVVTVSTVTVSIVTVSIVTMFIVTVSIDTVSMVTIFALLT